MNSLVTNPEINTAWKRIKGQYVVAACGLVLAVSAAVAISGDLRSPSSGLTSTAPAHAAASTNGGIDASTRPEVAFYLVATDEQAETIQATEAFAQRQRSDLGVAEPFRSIVVLIAGTSEQEAFARKLIDDSMAASSFKSDADAPSFEIIDMR